MLAPTPGGLNADTVAQRTVATSPTVRARLAEVDVARARLNETLAQYFPTLTLRASYNRLSPVSTSLSGGALVGVLNPGPLSVGTCPTGTGQCVVDSQGLPAGASRFVITAIPNQWAFEAALTVPISDYILRLSSALSGASANRHAAELQVQAERLKLRADARALFYDWLRAKARVAIAEKSLERTRARLKDAGPQFQLGVITKADLMRLEALEASTEQVLVEARAFRDLTVRQLGILMGDRGPVEYTVGEDVGMPLTPIQGDLDRFTAEALSSRIELKALAESQRSARKGASAARFAALPRVDVLGDLLYANPNQRYFPPTPEWKTTWSLGVAATWTLGNSFLSTAQASELEATARSLEAQRASVADGIRQEVATQYLAREQADGALQSARRGVAAAEEAYRVATDLYRVGKATTTELIDSETDLLSARLTEVNARLQLRIAEVRLRHAVGRDIAR